MDPLNLLGGVLNVAGNIYSAKQSAKAAALAREQAAAEGAANRAAIARQNQLNLAYQRDANRQARADKQQDRRLQEVFAKRGVTWRVADAKKAGIHPLYALGATGASYTPSALQVGTPGVAAEYAPTTSQDVPRLMAQSGQDFGRAISATRTALDRDAAFNSSVQALTVQKLGLENELLASQIAKMRGQIGPPMPSALPATGPLPPIPEDTKQEPRPPLQFAGMRVYTDPGTSNTEEGEKRWGDDGPASWMWGLGTMWRDLQTTHAGHNMTWQDWAKIIDRGTAMQVPQLYVSPSQIREGMRSWYPR